MERLLATPNVFPFGLLPLCEILESFQKVHLDVDRLKSNIIDLAADHFQWASTASIMQIARAQVHSAIWARYNHRKS